MLIACPLPEILEPKPQNPGSAIYLVALESKQITEPLCTLVAHASRLLEGLNHVCYMFNIWSMLSSP